MKKGKLILISGPSGVGKGSVRKLLKFKDYYFSVSSTTRPIREGEEDKVHYNFIDQEQFEEKIENGEMLEHAEFVGNYYGTDKSIVEEKLNNGENVLLEIECQGAQQVLSKMDDVVSIFIVPPTLEELERRLRVRGTEDEEKIQKRLAKAREELELKDKYKYIIENDVIEKAADQIDNILFGMHDEA